MSKNYELKTISELRESQKKIAKPRQSSGSQPLMLRQYRFRSFNAIAIMVLNICFSSFYLGFTMQYLGTFDFHIIRGLYHITLNQKSAAGLYNGVVPIGAGVGALSSFLLLRQFSRKHSLLAVNAIGFIFGILVFVKNPYLFFVCRFMQGMCAGLYSVIAPLIIKQLAPLQIAGTLGSMNQLIIAFGCFFACLLQLILKLANGHQQNYYFLMFGFTLITISVQTFTLLTVFRWETPKYLLQNNRDEQCKQLLKQIYLDQFVQSVLREKKIDLGLIQQQNEANPYTGLDDHQTPHEHINLHPKQKRNRLRLLVSIHLAMLQQFVGCNVIVIYGTLIASQILPSLKNLIPVILNLEQTLAALMTSYLLMRLGRKQILQRGTAGCVLALLAVTYGFYMFDNNRQALGGTIIVGSLIIFMAIFGLSLGPIVWLYIPEILEPELISISTLVNWSSASVIVISFPILREMFGSCTYLFFFYAVYSTCGFFLSQKYVIQTKGKTQKQIYDEYQNLAQ